MRVSLVLALASLSVCAAAPAFAATDISLPSFTTVELRDGGEVVIHSGAQQRVTLVEGDQRFTHFAVDHDGKLRIETSCNNDCPHQYRLRVEIVMPHLAGRPWRRAVRSVLKARSRPSPISPLPCIRAVTSTFVPCTRPMSPPPCIRAAA